MILKVHLQGARCYDVGDEIWQQSLAAAIAAEAETIADYATADLCQSPGQAGRDALRDRTIAEMTAALRHAGDRYAAPDGVVYSLLDEPPADPRPGQGTLSAMTPPTRDPVVEAVLRFEKTPGRLGRHPPGDRALERRHRGPGDELVCRRNPRVRGRSWELSAYVLSR